MLRNASGHAPCVAFSQTVDVFFKVRPAISEASGDGLTLPSRCETHLAGSSVERTGGKRVVPLVAIDRAVVGFAPGPSFEARGQTKNGGARRDRTDDLMLAKHALYQLSYGPCFAPAALHRAAPCSP
jgi:hypothetical protein